MNRLVQWSGLSLSILASIVLAGCNGASEPETSDGAHGHDHGAGHSHEHATLETFAEALKEVESLHAKIKEGFEADDIDAAHDPLHEIGHALEELPKLAGEESLSEEDQQQVKKSVDTLMDSYGAVDERLHADETVGKSYDEVSEQIDAAMAELQAIEVSEE